MEAVHLFDFDGLVVEGFRVMFEGEVEDFIVEVEEVLIAESFAEVAPGEGRFELEGAGHFTPPDFVFGRALAGQ